MTTKIATNEFLNDANSPLTLEHFLFLSWRKHPWAFLGNTWQFSQQFFCSHLIYLPSMSLLVRSLTLPRTFWPSHLIYHNLWLYLSFNDPPWQYHKTGFKCLFHDVKSQLTETFSYQETPTLPYPALHPMFKIHSHFPFTSSQYILARFWCSLCCTSSLLPYTNSSYAKIELQLLAQRQ